MLKLILQAIWIYSIVPIGCSILLAMESISIPCTVYTLLKIFEKSDRLKNSFYSSSEHNSSFTIFVRRMEFSIEFSILRSMEETLVGDFSHSKLGK